MYDYAIYDYKEKNGKVNFNNATMDCPSGETFTLQHLTNKSYYSKKPLFLDIEYTHFNDGGLECLGISKETFEFLRDNYTNLGGKIFQTEEERYKTNKAAGDLAWCSVMKDPYDVG